MTEPFRMPGPFSFTDDRMVIDDVGGPTRTELNEIMRRHFGPRMDHVLRGPGALFGSPTC